MPKITGIELTEQEARDILTTSIESGAIGYWANDHGPVQIWRDPETLDIFKIVITADNEQGDRNTYLIDTETIKTASNKIVQESVKGHARALANDIIEGDVDSDGADYIVQLACFGKVIYG